MSRCATWLSCRCCGTASGGAWRRGAAVSGAAVGSSSLWPQAGGRCRAALQGPCTARLLRLAGAASRPRSAAHLHARHQLAKHKSRVVLGYHQLHAGHAWYLRAVPAEQGGEAAHGGQGWMGWAAARAADPSCPPHAGTHSSARPCHGSSVVLVPAEPQTPLPSRRPHSRAPVYTGRGAGGISVAVRVAGGNVPACSLAAFCLQQQAVTQAAAGREQARAHQGQVGGRQHRLPQVCVVHGGHACGRLYGYFVVGQPHRVAGQRALLQLQGGTVWAMGARWQVSAVQCSGLMQRAHTHSHLVCTAQRDPSQATPALPTP